MMGPEHAVGKVCRFQFGAHFDRRLAVDSGDRAREQLPVESIGMRMATPSVGVESSIA